MYLDLLYEDSGSVFIVVFTFKNHGNIYEMLNDLGFKYNEDFYIGSIGGYMPDYDAVDSLLGYNRYMRLGGGRILLYREQIQS